LSLPALSYLLVYVIALGLAAILPYLVNANLRQRLQSEGILRERQRLSREIHDGAAQTLTALCWQVQLLRRRLAERDIDLPDLRILERLAERARQDTRQPLELLRSYSGNGSFLRYLKDYLEQLKRDININFRFDAEPDVHLESPVELELVRICQEALTNVRRHAGAHNVEFKLKRVNKHLEVSIVDDGCGFNALPYYHDGVEGKGHGLAVMQERAESVGGRLQVLSMPGQGTRIQVEVPVNHCGNGPLR
jgi:signal transduction histidine kinase